MSPENKSRKKGESQSSKALVELIVVSLWVSLCACDSADKNEFKNRTGPTIGSDSLVGKRFDDSEFKCLTLSSAEGEGLGLLQAKKVTYKADIEPLFAKKCVSCHPAVSPPDLKTYDAVKKTATANYNTMVDGSMPPGKPMPQEEIQLFKTWMDTGMVEGTAGAPSPAPAPKGKGKGKGGSPKISPACAAPSGLEKETPAAVAPKTATGPTASGPAKAVYLGGIEPILKVKCVNCHGPGATPPDLSTYALAKQEGASSKATIDDGSMPPPATKVTMTAEEKALFTDWVNKGYPEK